MVRVRICFSYFRPNEVLCADEIVQKHWRRLLSRKSFIEKTSPFRSFFFFFSEETARWRRQEWLTVLVKRSLTFKLVECLRLPGLRWRCCDTGWSKECGRLAGRFPAKDWTAAGCFFRSRYTHTDRGGETQIVGLLQPTAQTHLGWQISERQMCW